MNKILKTSTLLFIMALISFSSSAQKGSPLKGSGFDTLYVESPEPPYELKMVIAEVFYFTFENHVSGDTISVDELKKCFEVKPIDKSLTVKSLTVSLGGKDPVTGKFTPINLNVDGNRLSEDQHTKLINEMQMKKSFRIYVIAQKGKEDVLAEHIDIYIKQ